jgi:hypothetical protein
MNCDILLYLLFSNINHLLNTSNHIFIEFNKNVLIVYNSFA